MEDNINKATTKSCKKDISIIAITPNLKDTSKSIESYLKELKRHQIDAVVFRNKAIASKKFIKLFNNFHEEFSNSFSVNLFANCSEETFNDIKDLADGIHLTAERLMNLKAKKFNKIYGASCHNKKEIIKASNSKLDYCFLGPVQKNIYKKKYIGWDKFNNISSFSEIKVYALGGLSIENLKVAKKNNAAGIASISSFNN